ncbi:MAG: hypothetical protein AAGF47_02180 [Planctomycetota bacterium]
MRQPPLHRIPAAALALLRLAAATGFRLRGRYWRWRMQTAFGRGRPGPAQLTASLLDYGEWVARMRAMSRPVGPPTARTQTRLPYPSEGPGGGPNHSDTAG